MLTVLTLGVSVTGDAASDLIESLVPSLRIFAAFGLPGHWQGNRWRNPSRGAVFGRQASAILPFPGQNSN
jgi:hypothetical protein